MRIQPVWIALAVAITLAVMIPTEDGERDEQCGHHHRFGGIAALVLTERS